MLKTADQRWVNFFSDRFISCKLLLEFIESDIYLSWKLIRYGTCELSRTNLKHSEGLEILVKKQDTLDFKTVWTLFSMQFETQPMVHPQNLSPGNLSKVSFLIGPSAVFEIATKKICSRRFEIRCLPDCSKNLSLTYYREKRGVHISSPWRSTRTRKIFDKACGIYPSRGLINTIYRDEEPRNCDSHPERL